MIEVDCVASQLALTRGHEGQKRVTFIGQDHRLALGVAHVAQEPGKVFADRSGKSAMLLMASKADQDTAAGRIVSWNLGAL
jgi:acyl-CoA reductase-like NAD-dependent aldehyde dehydrogenase